MQERVDMNNMKIQNPMTHSHYEVWGWGNGSDGGRVFLCVCARECIFSNIAAYQQLTSQKQKPNHDEASLQDYSGSELKGKINKFE